MQSRDERITISALDKRLITIYISNVINGVNQVYARDMPVMRAHALASPQGLTDIIGFVLSTIKQPLQSVKAQMIELRAHGAASKYLFGSKRAGYAYALEHAEVLFAAITKAVDVKDTIGAIDVLSNIPGLGIVKAAFIAQIVGLEASCLDGHNLKRLGLSETAFKLAKSVKPETKRAKIRAYLELCCKTGGAEYWWNTWCEYVAGNKGNKRLTNADLVSAYHAYCLKG
jgi:hypothetical protein